MVRYKFWIQNCIDVVIESNNKDEARRKLIDSLRDYGAEMADSSVVSNGEEVKEDGKT